jgi:hypothetical protein
MDALPFANPSNLQVLNAIRGIAGSDYQARVPAATKANVQETVEQMWDFAPTRNRFIDALVNVIGSQIVKYNTWNNPLAKYKRGLLRYGETIEEIAVGLLNAYHYSAEREYLEQDIFGREPNEVQSRFHKLNRQDFYKLTVNEQLLRQAFFNEGGVSNFLTALMQQITTSDNWDEFLLMSRLFRIYYDEGGFYKVNTPDLMTGNASKDDAMRFLVQARELADTLPFLSRKYNAAKMPVVAQKNQLELILTPRGQAVIDVQALSAAFNVGSAELSSRTTIVPEEYLDIPGVQAILTTRDFFIVADNLMEMRQAQNPVGLHQNYFWHHWQTISASPFVPAILFTTEDATETIILQSRVEGISALTLIDAEGTTVTTAERGEIYEVQGEATLSNVQGSNGGLTFTILGRLSSRTRITQGGVLVIGYDEAASSITVHAQATDDPGFTANLVVPLTGPVVRGAIGQTVDEDVTTLTNTRLPGITPQTGGVGTEFTTNHGSWDQTPDSFTIQWKADGVNISGATGVAYTAASGDAGKVLSSAVTAHKTGFTNVTAESKGVTLAS